MKKTTNAIITKFIKALKNDPHFMTTGPSASVAVSQDPPGINGDTTGITMSFTNDWTRVVNAAPIMNAIASAIALYSLRKSIKFFTKLIDTPPLIQ